MKKLTLLGVLFLATIQFTFAGASDYWQGKGRIAYSSDGNHHDEDDWSATAATLMILAKAGLQDQFVTSYNFV